MKAMIANCLKYQGFTLIEMSVVLIIIGLLIGSFLTPLSKQVDQLKIESTEKKLTEIKESLLGFAIINGYLPCPDTNNDGIENDTTAECNAEGDLPWADLGLNEGRRDEWGKAFRYRVDLQYTINFPSSTTTNSGLSVQDINNTSLVSNESNSTSRIIAVVFSSGKNTIAEGDNADADTVYTYSEYIEGSFDDILIWIPKSILIHRLAVAGKWPP